MDSGIQLTQEWNSQSFLSSQQLNVFPFEHLSLNYSQTTSQGYLTHHTQTCSSQILSQVDSYDDKKSLISSQRSSQLLVENEFQNVNLPSSQSFNQFDNDKSKNSNNYVGSSEIVPSFNAKVVCSQSASQSSQKYSQQNLLLNNDDASQHFNGAESLSSQDSAFFHFIDLLQESQAAFVEKFSTNMKIVFKEKTDKSEIISKLKFLHKSINEHRK